jgi:hypothetical protein
MSEKTFSLFGDANYNRHCVLCESSDAVYTFRGCPVCQTCIDHVSSLNAASHSTSEPDCQ